MYVNFDEMPKSSRVWVYQSSRTLDAKEVEWLESVARIFCEQWAAHGQDLRSSFRIYHNQFLVLSVDEAASLPSGCSIDSSVHLVTHAQNELGIDFFDRMKVAYILNDQVLTDSINNLKAKISNREITQHTKTFNNLVATIDELEHNWTVPVGQSWLKKYFA